jgi:hypothetical protein
MKAAQPGWLQLFSLSVLWISSTALAETFLDEEQKVCLAICGVDYDELMEAVNTTTAIAPTIGVDGEVSETTSPPKEAAEQILRILSFDTGSMDLMGRQVCLTSECAPNISLFCLLIIKCTIMFSP